ncbi:hypothetical protein ACFXKC_03035 [Streptomyces sp. NPDC059340]|uniref:hypothetical protein n=1 Tax=Streptomyces sp. NPDC059340 TaxID=3346806 RepID=UPI00369B8A33
MQSARIRPPLIVAERIDWVSLYCGCGKAGHIQDNFANLLEANTDQIDRFVPDRFAYFDVKLIGRVKKHAKRR